MERGAGAPLSVTVVHVLATGSYLAPVPIGFPSAFELDNGSSIQVYDLVGNLVESINGLNFQGGDNVFPIHITLNPNRRTGFVIGPDLTTEIQSFNY